MKVKINIIILILLFFSNYAIAHEEETISLVTYYPAPYGDYENITSNTLEIFNTISNIDVETKEQKPVLLNHKLRILNNPENGILKSNGEDVEKYIEIDTENSMIDFNLASDMTFNLASPYNLILEANAFKTNIINVDTIKPNNEDGVICFDLSGAGNRIEFDFGQGKLIFAKIIDTNKYYISIFTENIGLVLKGPNKNANGWISLIGNKINIYGDIDTIGTTINCKKVITDNIEVNKNFTLSKDIDLDVGKITADNIIVENKVIANDVYSSSLLVASYEEIKIYDGTPTIRTGIKIENNGRIYTTASESRRGPHRINWHPKI